MYMCALMHVCQSWCDWKMLISWSIPSPLALPVFLCSLFWIPEWGEEGRGLADILLSEECSKVSHFLHIVQLWVSLLHIPIYGKSVSGEGCEMLCSMEERHEKKGGKM